MQQKVWVYKDIDNKQAASLAESAGISGLLAKLFVSRGICDTAAVKNFLEPEIKNMHSPFLMDGMEKAVNRILKAISSQEQILIYGDYDVDGVASTSILYNFLSSQNAKVQYFLPDRVEDGYGLTMTAVEKVRELEASLIITVDCGITSVDEIRCLQEDGMQVIVTDHHECKEIIPGAFAVLNPHKPGCTYPFKELAGAGVAFKLIQAICIRMGLNSEYLKYIDLAALATIADIVPLLDENRIIASFGLKKMEETKNEGLKALIQVSGLGEKPITSYGAAFGLAPRVNAAGRLGSALRSVRLFTAGDRVLAEALAKELDSENRNRQETEAIIIEEAVKYVEEKLDPMREKVLVVQGEGWHHGVIGIVASKLLERYNRPCIVVSVEDGIGKGSGRSLKCLNLFSALCSCEKLLERFGGHEMAAGLTIKAENIEMLRQRINEYADSLLTPADLLPCIRIDSFLDRSDIITENVNELMKLAPYGAGNPGPVFAYTAFSTTEARALSGGKHMKFKFTDGNLAVEAIGFNMGNLAGEVSNGDVVDAVFSLELNSWNGSERLQLNLKDVKPSIFIALDKNIVFDDTNDYNMYYNSVQMLCSQQGYCRPDLSELVPERSELEAVYRHIRSCCRLLKETGNNRGNASGKGFNAVNAAGSSALENKLEFTDLFLLSALISEKFKENLNYLKLKRCLDIFEELGLLRKEPAGQKGVVLRLAESGKKVELEASRIFNLLQQLKKINYIS